METQVLIASMGVVGVLLGALVAGGFALAGPSLQSRHERAKWLREERLRAYSDFLGSIEQWMDAGVIQWVEAKYAKLGDLAEVKTRARALEHEVLSAQSRLLLVGPDSVRSVAADYHRAAVDRIQLTMSATDLATAVNVDLSQIASVRGLLLAVMNRVLGIAPH